MQLCKMEFFRLCYNTGYSFHFRFTCADDLVCCSEWLHHFVRFARIRNVVGIFFILLAFFCGGRDLTLGKVQDSRNHKMYVHPLTNRLNKVMVHYS